MSPFSPACRRPRRGARLIAYWNFNDQNLMVDQGAGTLTTTFSSEDVAYYAGTSLNALPGVAAGKALSLKDDANNGEHIIFAIDTTNYFDIQLSFATRRTDTGFNNNAVTYSTDGGKTFVDFDTYNPTLSADFAIVTFDFSSITALNNNPNAQFRIIFKGASSSSGNNRLDNVQFRGTAVRKPSALWLLAPGTCLPLGVAGRGWYRPYP